MNMEPAKTTRLREGLISIPRNGAGEENGGPRTPDSAGLHPRLKQLRAGAMNPEAARRPSARSGPGKFVFEIKRCSVGAAR